MWLITLPAAIQTKMAKGISGSEPVMKHTNYETDGLDLISFTQELELFHITGSFTFIIVAHFTLILCATARILLRG